MPPKLPSSDRASQCEEAEKSTTDTSKFIPEEISEFFPKLRPQSWVVPKQLPPRNETRGPAPTTRNGLGLPVTGDGRAEAPRAGARAEPFMEARGPGWGRESCKGAEPAQTLGIGPETCTMETSIVCCLFL